LFHIILFSIFSFYYLFFPLLRALFYNNNEVNFITIIYLNRIKRWYLVLNSLSSHTCTENLVHTFFFVFTCCFSVAEKKTQMFNLVIGKKLVDEYWSLGLRHCLGNSPKTVDLYWSMGIITDHWDLQGYYFLQP